TTIETPEDTKCDIESTADKSEKSFHPAFNSKLCEGKFQNHDTPKLRKVLHEKLDAIKNTSFLVDKVGDLQAAIESVDKIHQKLISSCPNANGILLRSSPVKKKLKINKTEYHQVFHKSLPKRKKWRKKDSLAQKTEKIPICIIEGIEDDALYNSDIVVAQRTSFPQEDFDANKGCGDHSQRRKHEPLSRLINATKMGFKLHDVLLDFGQTQLTLGDLWTLIPPKVARMHSLETSSLTNFHPGWLIDKVVEASLWMLTLEYNVFAADASLTTIAKRGASTRLLWSGQCFSSVSKIFVPINEYGIHWTLLVIDKSKKIRYFIDPMNGQKEITIDFQTHPHLMDLIDKISEIADMKTGWHSQFWSCIEPLHFSQQDSFNCGVLICLVSEHSHRDFTIHSINLYIAHFL
ncbi:uncharacterized protein LOC124454791, partial [Xenia sp. Carnegie-2017]|uniref:uncharacterized protein LOC124454791 n=1 Tax=Xenia sp. Carnegie-2017 TaxID=2897299 RepID=UPI001F039FBE